MRCVTGYDIRTGEYDKFYSNGVMSDGSLTYIKFNSEDGLEDDGKYRQYQRDRQYNFYLLTED